MNRHYSEHFWHYGYENETELHVFVYGGVRGDAAGSTNVFGIFFGYADKRNAWGEVEGFVSTERAELGAVNNALKLVQNDNRILYVHTTNVQVVDRLEHWIPQWTETKFKCSYNEQDAKNADLIQSLARLLEARTRDVYFESIYQASKVAGCALAISLAQEECRPSAAAKQLGVPQPAASAVPAARQKPQPFRPVYPASSSPKRADRGSYFLNDQQNASQLEPREFAVSSGTRESAASSDAAETVSNDVSVETLRGRGRFEFTQSKPKAATLVAN